MWHRMSQLKRGLPYYYYYYYYYCDPIYLCILLLPPNSLNSSQPLPSLPVLFNRTVTPHLISHPREVNK